MIQQLQAQALAAWKEIHPDKVKPTALDYLMQSRDYIIIFWFDSRGESKGPVLISKIPRTKNFNRYAERSIRLVDQLLTSLKQPVRKTLPTRVIAGQVNGLTHIAMGLVPGEPITIPVDNYLGRRETEMQISAFLRWLIEFQVQAAKGSKKFAWGDFIKAAQDEPGLDILRSEPYCSYSQELVGRLPDSAIPATFGYGDAHHSNILIEGGKVSGVIDWIGVKEETWFFTDWYYFLFFYALEFFKKNSKVALHDQHQLAISATLGVGDHWLTRIFQEKTELFLKQYTFDLGLNPEFALTFLYDLHWPQGKDQLLKDAHSIYSTAIR